jgi:ABC-type multidrug transport system ATPase subunit
MIFLLPYFTAPAPGISITGHVEVAGKKINPVAFRENIAYVMQEDALMPTATPREALWFSAKLRLPNSTTNEEIDNLVKDLLKDLGLESCADTLIGGALIKGISGGQKKRTSVGVELITDPALLFLDEPTSGLDSFSAFNMIQLLKAVSESNSAVLCTIHQPSSEVFFLFDILIFLKDGRIFYQGPPKDLVPHLSKGGFICPANYNPSDYIMFVC